MEDSAQTPVAETPAATLEQPATPAAEAVAEAPAQPAAEPAPQPEQPAAAAPAATGTVVPPSGDASAPAGLGTPVLVGIAVVVIAVIVVAVLLGKRGGKSAKGAAGSGAAPAKSSGDVVEIYVGNLSYDMTEAQFRKEFEKFGVVKSARIIGHRTSGKSKGYGFVEMPHRKEALVAIKALNNREILGRKLRVNEARNGTREE